MKNKDFYGDQINTTLKTSIPNHCTSVVVFKVAHKGANFMGRCIQMNCMWALSMNTWSLVKFT